MDVSSSIGSVLSKSSESYAIKFDSTDSSFLRNVDSYCADNPPVADDTQPEAPRSRLKGA